MRNQKEWVDAYKDAEKLKSDYQLSKIWNINTAQMSQIKSGKTKFSLEQIYSIAEALEIDPMEIIVSTEYFREKDESRKARIQEIFLKYSSTALTVLAMFLAVTTNNPVLAGNITDAARNTSNTEQALSTSHNVYYVKL